MADFLNVTGIGRIGWVGMKWVVVAAGLLAGTLAHADAPAPALVASPLGDLTQSNPFDPERRPWPDVVPPPPPIPVPVAVTDADLQVYGVVVAGSVRKAILKLGPRFSGVPVGANGFASVSQGGQLGEFTLAVVQPDQVLLQAPGGQQWIRFSLKTDRNARGAPAVAAAQSQPAALMVPLPAMAGAPMGGQAPMGAPAGFGVPTVGANDAVNPVSSLPAAAAAAPAGSLAAAIFAAQAAQGGNRNAAPAPTGAPMVNPFEALLKQQQAR